MAVQFPCPACQQPIEVDDNWAGQNVACPYCRRVVTAPMQSTWPPGDIPVASPAAGRAYGPPPPPAGYPRTPVGPPYAPAPTRSAGPSYAGWALMLAIASAILTFVASMMVFGPIAEQLTNEFGSNPPPEAVQKRVEEMMIRRSFAISPGTGTVLFVGTFCGVAALILAILSLVRREGRPVKAASAIVITCLFAFCQVLLMVFLFGPRPA